MSERKAIAEDFKHDPTFERQRFAARYLIAAIINQLRGFTPMFYRPVNDKDMADHAEKIARELGIIAPPDSLHHAPACPSNQWAGQILPFQPCNCEAAQALARVRGEGEKE